MTPTQYIDHLNATLRDHGRVFILIDADTRQGKWYLRGPDGEPVLSQRMVSGNPAGMLVAFFDRNNFTPPSFMPLVIDTPRVKVWEVRA